MAPLWRRAHRQYRFRDRIDAGQQLASSLTSWRGTDVLVLGLPRGGVPVAAEVARELGAELDVTVARKLGAPRQPELAIGAVTADGSLFLDTALVRDLRVSEEALDGLIAREREEAQRREQRFRADWPMPRVEGRPVIVVDDGLATGATMNAAVRSLRARGPARIVVAVPVGSSPARELLRAEADEVVCLHTPEPLRAVGQFYEDFSPTEDAEVDRILSQFH